MMAQKALEIVKLEKKKNPPLQSGDLWVPKESVERKKNKGTRRKYQTIGATFLPQKREKEEPG